MLQIGNFYARIGKNYGGGKGGGSVSVEHHNE